MESELSGATSPPCIGVFDSGVGGLSVLRALRAALPQASLRYYADSAHAPYGERDRAHVVGRCLYIADRLVERGAVALVVACNTATALAIDTLRDAWPALPIVGVEPGVKPAVALSRVRRIGVLATPGTLASERFRRLVESYAGNCEVIAQPCPGLAASIETGEVDGPRLAACVAAFCAPLRERGVDVVALGCTHYPFVRHHVAAAMGSGVAIVDTAAAVARQVAVRCGAATGSGRGAISLGGSGDLAPLRRLAACWLRFDDAIIEAAEPAAPR